MKLIMTTILVLMSQQAFAMEKEDTFFALQTAVMNSNKDYNEHKKNFNEEEENRSELWADRKHDAIMIKENLDLYQPNVQSEESERQISSEVPNKSLDVSMLSDNE